MIARSWHHGLAIFFVLLGAYLLTYSGTIHSDDELSVLGVTESLYWTGTPRITQLAWNQNQAGGIGNYGPDGELYSKYGLGQSLWLFPLYWLAHQIRALGLIQTALLLNAPVTALTGAVVFWIGEKLGYSRPAALLGGLTFGLATIAWVYARYAFSEPVVTLALAAAFLWLLRRKGRDYTAIGIRPWLAGLALGAALLTRPAAAVAIPVLAGLTLAEIWTTPASSALRRLRATLHHALALALPVLLALLITATYNVARFGNPLQAGYNADEGFQGSLLEGLYGFLISPGKSLFLYSPALFLGVLGFPALIRRWRTPGWAALALVVVTLLINAKWHAWHGGWGWGPRLVLPVFPFLILAALPVLEQVVSGRPRLVRWLVVPLLIISVLVTLLGVLVDFNVYLGELLQQNPRWQAGVMFLTLWDFSNSPFAAHLRLVRDGVLDLAWWNTPGLETSWNLVGLLLPLSFLAGALLLLGALLRARFTAAVWPLMSVAAAFTLLGVALVAYSDRRYGPDRASLLAALAAVEAASTPGQTLALVAPMRTAPLMNYNRTLPVRFNVGPERGDVNPRTRVWLTDLERKGRRAWLLFDQSPYADPNNAIERALDTVGFKATNDWFGESRLASYGFAAAPANRRGVSALFGERLWLDAAAFGAAPPGDVARLDLYWRVMEPLGERYAVSIRLAGQDGRVWVQRDREPTDAILPTDQWQVGVEIPDPVGLPLPRTLPAGIYLLQIVVYPKAGGEPLKLLDGTTTLTLQTLRLAANPLASAATTAR